MKAGRWRQESKGDHTAVWMGLWWIEAQRTTETLRKNNSPGKVIEGAVKGKERMSDTGTELKDFRGETTEFSQWIIEGGSEKRNVGYR